MKIDGKQILVFLIASVALIQGAYGSISLSGGTSVSCNAGSSAGGNFVASNAADLTDSHWVANQAGDYAEIGIDIKGATTPYTYSYSINPGEDVYAGN